MVWFCAAGCHKIRENFVPVTKKMDFRKAAPTYVNFEPTTAADAINKFYRHKNLGVPPHLWPEVFVKCAAKLPPAEMAKFESWLVNPEGAPTGTLLGRVDRENEVVRMQLEAEADARDALQPVEEDEKHEDSVSSMLTNLDLKDGGKSSARTPCLQQEDFDMITV